MIDTEGAPEGAPLTSLAQSSGVSSMVSTPPSTIQTSAATGIQTLRAPDLVVINIERYELLLILTNWHNEIKQRGTPVWTPFSAALTIVVAVIFGNSAITPFIMGAALTAIISLLAFAVVALRKATPKSPNQIVDSIVETRKSP